ncbi:MAG: amidohydrolase family protein, partial [Ferruginibacter sp.]
MKWIFTLGFICFIQCSYSQVYIKNITVADVEKHQLLQGYNVLCQQGKIVSVTKNALATIPEGIKVIDGTGKFLVPGFTDAHIHFFQSGGIFTRPDVIDLRKYQPYDEQIIQVHANMESLLRSYAHAGITSVIDVGASYRFLAQADTFRNRAATPEIRITGPLLTTYIPEPYKNLKDKEEAPFELLTTEEGVRAAVKKQIPLHADFIKIWYIVLDKDKEQGARKNLPLIKAAIDEAHKNNLRVAVHSTERITAQLAVEAGADFLVHSVDDEIISNEFVQLLKKKNTVLCPTLVVVGNYDKMLGGNYHFSTEELSLGDPFAIASVINYPMPDTVLAARYIKLLSTPEQISRVKTTDSIMYANLARLVSAGVTIATGTDAGNIGTQHVSSYFEELRAMQAAGMNMWQLLEASTINGAKATGEQETLGSVSKNKIANMVLLSANPLERIENWRKVDDVIIKGVPYTPESFQLNSPEILVQQQLNAYNAHNLEAFLQPYAEDVEIYKLPATLETKGKDAMRKNYEFIEKVPTLHCRLVNRIVEGNMVIDHEEVKAGGR